MSQVVIDIVSKVSGQPPSRIAQDFKTLNESIAKLRDVTGQFGGMASKAFAHLKEGQQAVAVARNFDALTKSIGGSADVLGKLRSATAGMVDDTTLMANANSLLTMGIADSASSLQDHFEIVTKLKKPTDDMASAMENWALMMANQSIPRLDSFGISSGKVRDRIRELQQANKDMTRETAFTIATLEQAEVAMDRVADSTQGAGADIARMTADLENLKGGLQVTFAQALAPAVSNLAGLVDQVKQINAAVKESEGGINRFGGSMLSWAETLEMQTTPAVEDVANATDILAQTTAVATGEMEASVQAYDDVAIAAAGVTTEIEFQDYAYEGARGSIEMQNVALRQNEIDQDNAAAAAEELRIAQEEAAAAADAHARLLGGHFYDAVTSAQAETKTLEERLFEEAAAAGATDEALVLLAAATGNFTEEQIKAALEAAAMKAKIEELAAAVAAGDLTAQQAINTLQGFQTQMQMAGNQSDTTASQVDNLTGSATIADERVGLLGEEAIMTGGKMGEMGTAADNAKPRVDNVGGAAHTAAQKAFLLRDAANQATSAINNIPSGKTFTLTFKTKGSITVPGVIKSGGVPDAGIDASVGGGGGSGGTGGTYQPPPPPPPPPSGGGGGGGFQPLQHGGVITGGVLGRDSVPALLMPGERVLTVGQNRKLEEGKLGNNITIHMPINVGAGMGPSMGPDPQRLATAINQQAYDTLFRAFRRMGLAR